jgi:hypothetical protein
MHCPTLPDFTPGKQLIPFFMKLPPRPNAIGDDIPIESKKIFTDYSDFGWGDRNHKLRSAICDLPSSGHGTWQQPYCSRKASRFLMSKLGRKRKQAMSRALQVTALLIGVLSLLVEFELYDLKSYASTLGIYVCMSVLIMAYMLAP